MITLCHAAKGGSGTSIVASVAALAHRGPTLLIDFDDELPLLLGVPAHERPGVVDWLASEAPEEHLDDLLVDLDDSTAMLSTRRSTVEQLPRLRTMPADLEAARWLRLTSWCADWARRHDGRVIVDGGTQPLPAEFLAACSIRWLVTRACYLSLTQAGRTGIDSTGVVLVAEPGRSLRTRDIEVAARAPIVATVPWDPQIARAVDAGLLRAGRLPRPMMREFTKLMRPASPAPSVAA